MLGGLIPIDAIWSAIDELHRMGMIVAPHAG